MTQKEALDILKMGHNVFLTGAAGSGKTYLLNQYIAYLKAHGVSVGITASTGIAATHMGGTTIHSFCGMGIKDSLSPVEMADLTRRSYLRSRFERTKVLIIDEISMLHGKRLDLVDMICRRFKKVDLPFGGMQIIMCGDFFQLPPVHKIQNSEFRIQNDSKEDFVFTSQIWQEMRLKICYLEEQYRQDDRSFLRVLNDIRNNEVSEMTVEYLSERLNAECHGYTRPTRLFTHNTDVDAINKKHLEELPGEGHEYYMSSRGSLALTESLKRSCLAPEVLILKKGAQVMFVKNNYDTRYVNGTLGEVIGFDKDDHPIIRTFDGDEIPLTTASWEVKEENSSAGSEQVKASIAQLPLRLAWAITVHKSQGMSLDAAEIDLARSFIPGMGYVALSRVRSLQGLKLMGLNQMALQVHPEIAEIDRQFLAESNENVSLLARLEKEKKKSMQEQFLAYLKNSGKN